MHDNVRLESPLGVGSECRRVGEDCTHLFPLLCSWAQISQHFLPVWVYFPTALESGFISHATKPLPSWNRSHLKPGLAVSSSVTPPPPVLTLQADIPPQEHRKQINHQEECMYKSLYAIKIPLWVYGALHSLQTRREARQRTWRWKIRKKT